MEGIWADVNALQVSQDLIREDLKKLDEIKALLKQPADPRQKQEFALEYYEKALKIFEDLRDERSAAVVKGNKMSLSKPDNMALK